MARDKDKIVAMVNLLYTVSTALGERVATLEDMLRNKDLFEFDCLLMAVDYHGFHTDFNFNLPHLVNCTWPSNKLFQKLGGKLQTSSICIKA